MSKFQKLFGVVSVLLLVSFIAACGGGSDNPSDPSTPTPTPAVQNPVIDQAVSSNNIKLSPVSIQGDVKIYDAPASADLSIATTLTGATGCSFTGNTVVEVPWGTVTGSTWTGTSAPTASWKAGGFRPNEVLRVTANFSGTCSGKPENRSATVVITFR